MDRPFKVGELIDLDGETCRVEKIGLRTTSLLNLLDNEKIILPNSMVASTKISNITQPNGKRILSISIGVAYGTDIQKAESLMLQVANAHPMILKDNDNKPYIRFSEFGDSAINLSLFVTVDEVLYQWKALSDIREGIYKQFNQEKIEIPFPQSDIHIKSDSTLAVKNS